MAGEPTGGAAARDGPGYLQSTQLSGTRGYIAYNTQPLPVQFVFPHSRLLSSRVRQFLDAEIEPLQQRLSVQSEALAKPRALHRNSAPTLPPTPNDKATTGQVHRQ